MADSVVIDVAGIPDNTPATDYILANADQFPDRLCFLEDGTGRQLTFAQFQSQTKKLAAHLWNRGWRTGDVVIFFANSMIEYHIGYFAAIRIGVIINMINPSFLKEDLLRHLIAVDAKMVFASSDTINLVLESTEEYKQMGKPFKDIVILDKVPGLTDVTGLLDLDYPPTFPEVSFNPKEHLFGIFTTSGTSGSMKFAKLTHYGFALVLEALSDLFVQDSGRITEHILITMPCFAGLSIMLSQCSVQCGYLTLMPSKFELEDFLHSIEVYKVTMMFTTPGIVNALSKTPLLEKHDLSSLRDVISVGSKLSSMTIGECQKKLPKVTFKQGYGCTETGVIAISDKSCNLESVGKISRLTRVKIVDIETRKEVGLNEAGEILSQGPQLFDGYLNNPEAKVNSMENGWYKTGDVGYIDENGCLYIIDRLKDVIKVGTFQVSPSELESVILTHPAVLDVAVIGIPAKDETGENPKAFVVKRPHSHVNEEEIVQYVKARVAPLKHLTGGTEFVQAIPRNPTGKITRRTLREIVLQKKTW